MSSADHRTEKPHDTLDAAGWLKLIAIVAIAVCWDVFTHMLGPEIAYENPSPILADRSIFVPVITTSLFATFAALAVVFIRIQRLLTGSPLIKGLKFGVSFGGLWLLGILEMSIIFGSSFFVELFVGLADASTLVLLGVLLGHTFATPSPRQGRPWWSGIARSAPVVLSWVVVRYLGYFLMGMDTCYSSYLSRPLSTLIWTAATGIWIGVVYLLLRPRFSSDTCAASRALSTPRASRSLRWGAVTFPLVIFGIDWALFTSFVLIFVSGPTLTALFIRIVLDLVAVGLGTFIIERLGTASRADRSLGPELALNQ